jgi:hypothetical protein
MVIKSTGGESLTCKDTTTYRKKRISNIHLKLIEDAN